MTLHIHQSACMPCLMALPRRAAAPAAVGGPPCWALRPLLVACPSRCVKVRALRVRETEGVVRYGAELLSRHARKVDADESESSIAPAYAFPCICARLLVAPRCRLR